MRPTHITYNGKTKALKEWAKILGISTDCLRHRLFVKQWKLEKAMSSKMTSKPVGGTKLTKLEIHEVRKLYKIGKYSSVEIGKMFGKDHSTICYHCKRVKRRILKKKIPLTEKKVEQKIHRENKLKQITRDNRLKKYGAQPTKRYADYLREENRKVARLLLEK